MAKILVVAEHGDGHLKKATLQVLDFARQLAAKTGATYDIAVLGQGIESIAQDAARYGAGKVYAVDGAAFEHALAQPLAHAVAALAKAAGAGYVLASSGTTGKDFLPRVAAQLGWGMVSDAVGLAGDGEVLFKRPMYAGNLIASVRVTTPGAVVSVRTSAFDAVEAAGSAAPVEAVAGEAGEVSAKFVRFEGTKSERPELTEAEVVVSGGRGLKDGENFFAVMEPLADALGAAIGASRAAVDSGFCPNDFQVGQTGKAVAPKLYIAVAISGAIQHLAGMKNSKTIVAINKDSEAPIFQIADYGLVADAFKAVPELVGKLQAR